MLTDLDDSVYVDALLEVFEHFDLEDLGTDELAAVRGAYGFAEIHSWRKQAEAVQHPAFTAFDTDEVLNRVWIGIDDEDSLDSVELALTEAGIPIEAFQMSVTQIPSQQLTVPEVDVKRGLSKSHPAPGEPFDQYERPLVSGLLTSGASLGPIVRRDGQRVALMSGSLGTRGAVDSISFHQPVPVEETTWVGSEFEDPSYTALPGCPSGKLCRFSEAVLAHVGFNTTSRRGRIKNSYSPAALPSVGVAQAGASPLAGALVRISGGGSGKVIGHAKRTSTTFEITPNLTLLDQFWTSHATLPGDSGAPAWRLLSTGKVLVGMQSGLTTEHIPGTVGGYEWRTVFSSVAGLQADLGAMEFEHVDDPPLLAIVNPKDNDSIGDGNIFQVSFQAIVSDYEDGSDCNGCQVDWTSSVDGFLGTSVVSAGIASLDTTIYWPGVRQITATAKDASGVLSSTDTITVYTGNVPPQIWILEPQDGAQLTSGMPAVFSAGSFDTESFSGLACSGLLWSSSQPGDPSGFGCSTTLTFTSPGQRTITVSGADPNGAPAQAQVTVNVSDAAANGPLQVTHLQPLGSPLLQREQVHNLSAIAVDPDAAGAIQFEWLLKGSYLIGGSNGQVSLGSQQANSGSAATISWLPSNFVAPACGGVVLELEVVATTANNETDSASQQITVSGPLC